MTCVPSWKADVAKRHLFQKTWSLCVHATCFQNQNLRQPALGWDSVPTGSLVHRSSLFSSHLLRPWSTGLPEKLRGPSLLRKFLAFYGKPNVQYSIHNSPPNRSSSCPYPTSLRSIIISSSHLCLGFPSGFYPQVFPLKPYMHFYSSPNVLRSLPISVF